MDTRKEVLSKEQEAELALWIAQANDPEQSSDRILVYDHSQPTRFKTISKEMSLEEIDRAISELGASAAYMSKEDVHLMESWLMTRDRAEDDLKESVLATHEHGLSISIDRELVSKQPAKVRTLLNDSAWTLAGSGREKLEAYLDRHQPEPSDQFEYDGETYSKGSPLAKLKGLSLRIAEDESDLFPPEHAKKLLTWIAKKEKYGEPKVQKSEEITNLEDTIRKRTERLGRLSSLLNDMASNSSQTVDGYYSEIWGADKSAIAAGPFGATSGGLRPMGIWQFTEVIQSAMKDKLFIKQMGDMQKAGKEAALLKQAHEKDHDSASFRFRELGAGSGLLSSTEKQIHQLAKQKLDLAISQVYSSIQHFKTKERARNPNRDNKDIEEFIPPGPGAPRGPGGFGGIGL